MKKPIQLLIIVCSLLALSCEKEPTITNAMLDGETIFDPSLNNPEKYLISAKYPSPSAEDRAKHIIIAIHGYTATTFEWQEFADWTQANYGNDSTYRVSQVLMGAHGLTYGEFQKASWETWVESVKKEYQDLVNLGYTKISLVGASTGTTVLLHLLEDGFFNRLGVQPKNIFFVDGIVVPSIKTQSIANIVGPMIAYIEVDQSAREDTFWYRFRPQETIQELNKLMKVARKELERGITAPNGTYIKMFHSKNDPVASVTSAQLVYKGLKHADGSNVDIQLLDSDIHVFTRLSLRTSITDQQRANQLDCFRQMAARLN
jgi:carboxylesterase